MWIDNIKARNMEHVDLDKLETLWVEKELLRPKWEAAMQEKTAMDKNIKRGREKNAAEKDTIPDDIAAAARVLRSNAKELQSQMAVLDEEMREICLQLPNTIHGQTPRGGLHAEKELRTWNKERNFEFRPRSHVTLGQMHDLMDFKMAAQVAGSFFYYLKRDAALMELALIQYAMHKAIKRGWIPFTCPDIVRQEFAAACGFQPRDENHSQMYYVSPSSNFSPNGDYPKVLAGTAEIPLAGLMANTTFPESDGPHRFVGLGRAFRAEAGARGKDTKGLYRVHQFTKLELFAVTPPHQSAAVFDEMVSLQEEIFADLGLYIRVLRCRAGT